MFISDEKSKNSRNTNLISYSIVKIKKSKYALVRSKVTVK